MGHDDSNDDDDDDADSEPAISEEGGRCRQAAFIVAAPRPCFISCLPGTRRRRLQTPVLLTLVLQTPVVRVRLLQPVGGAFISLPPCPSCGQQADMRTLLRQWTQRAAPGIEPGTSRTRSKNHATRPSSQLGLRAPEEYLVGNWAAESGIRPDRAETVTVPIPRLRGNSAPGRVRTEIRWFRFDSGPDPGSIYVKFLVGLKRSWVLACKWKSSHRTDLDQKNKKVEEKFLVFSSVDLEAKLCRRHRRRRGRRDIYYK